MTDLSTRVAALSGPDRAVDAEIAEAIGWLYAPICPELDCHGIDRSQLFRSIRSTALCPRFTASLDAAMTQAEGMSNHQIWCLWNEALTMCSKNEGDLLKDVARYFTAAALKARGL